MYHDSSKPKLLFFQRRRGKDLPEFVSMHRLQQVKCLSEFFNVVLIQENCDYRQVCDQHEPDLALFEMLSDDDIVTTQRLDIANASACQGIPKLAFLNADAWGKARAGFISDMEHLGIETAFSICTTAAEHTPELADRLFVWPNFIDPDVYRDYSQAKLIPVLFTGATLPNYPWRRKVQSVVSKYYPSLNSPHHGYFRRSRIGQVMHGERYARVINASWFVPTCGTVAKEVLRKHFEIPACKACLITERSPALESAGFVDMENCVFADETTVLDKLAHLFEHQEEFTSIIQAGHDLVHSRHTLRQRDQILQWLRLHKKLRPGQRIVQKNPFGRLLVADESSGRSNHLTNKPVHLRLLVQGDAALWRGDYAAADVLYRRSSNYIPWMPEPKFRLALSNLYQGNARDAHARITESISYITNEYKAVDPDPVEWAYLIVSLLCLGKLNEASQRAGQFPALHHPELNYACWVVEALRTGGNTVLPPLDEGGIYRPSIHQLPRRTFKDWLEQLCIMLRACKQRDFSAVMIDLRSFPQANRGNGDPQKLAAAQQTGCARRHSNAASHRNAMVLLPRLRPRLQLARELARRYLPDTVRLLAATALAPNTEAGLQTRRICAQELSRRLLHPLERKYGYFLPYHLSEMRNDDFLWQVQNIAQQKTLRTALLLGAAKGVGITQAFLTGITENENKPVAVCVNSLTNEFISLREAFAYSGLVNCYGVPLCCPDEVLGELNTSIARAKEDHGSSQFDMVLVDGSKLAHQHIWSVILRQELHNATHVLLGDLTNPHNHFAYHHLLKDPTYILVACDPGLRNGYAIFEKHHKFATI
jgi:hypothetical protein